MKKILKSFLGVVIGFCIGAEASMLCWAYQIGQSDSLAGTAIEIDTTWRHTKHGWQDSSRWVIETMPTGPLLGTIHPVVWAGLVLIAVVGMMLWASEEWEFARLFGEQD